MGDEALGEKSPSSRNKQGVRLPKSEMTADTNESTRYHNHTWDLLTEAQRELEHEDRMRDESLEDSGALGEESPAPIRTGAPDLHGLAGSPSPKRYTVAVDFDGVLHQYGTPWISAEVIPDPPVPGAIAWLQMISKHFDVVIFTTRGKTPEGQRAVRHYLHEHGWKDGMNATVTAEKVPALVYLDDRAMRFEGTFPLPHQIHAARPWNKQ